MDADIEPPGLILAFLSEQPTAVRAGLFGQIAFMLSFLLPEESKGRLIGATNQVGEETVNFFLEQTGVGLVGATITIVSLVDFTFVRNVRAHEEVMPETKEALTEMPPSCRCEPFSTVSRIAAAGSGVGYRPPSSARLSRRDCQGPCL
jgi:hypothetical protein